ncbi:hypothetical protein ACFOQM_07995 [Paenibacillus sp. GCM10012307]|uniref:Uncharacterized protein n=1 Tax=Paenibacillus roseus TaxID=2798579 RepID=A0A934IXS8_9BACL|nr:hypothetical protein [Paenibacillus roseus]MBJ6361231.1 hypothetical protein [Paenibacillus roseus]
MGKQKVMILFLVLLLITFLYYNFMFSSTFAIVTLDEKIETYENSNKFIKLKFEDNSTVKVKVPDIVWPFLKIGAEYSVKYKQNLMRGPFVTRINPLNKTGSD